GATGRISGKRPRCWETTVVGATKPNARGTGRAGSRLLLRCGHPPHREAGTTGRSQSWPDVTSLDRCRPALAWSAGAMERVFLRDLFPGIIEFGRVTSSAISLR